MRKLRKIRQRKPISVVDDEMRDLETQKIDLTLLSNFVHQVINPLNGIAGTLDNIISGEIKEEHRKEQRLRATRAQIEQCVSLLRNLAYFSRGFGSLSEEQHDVISIPEMIIEAAMFFQEDAANKGIRINLEERWVQNKVIGHRELVMQVMMNIFDNCVKYSRPDSLVKVNQRIQKRTGDAIITVANESKNPVNKLELERFFELGFRGENAKMIVASGTGLGLYIAQEIVSTIHNGSITIQPQGQNKLEFIIRIPRGEAGREMRV